MNRRNSAMMSRKSYFDPANWLQNTPMQPAACTAAPAPISGTLDKAAREAGLAWTGRKNRAGTTRCKVIATDWRGASNQHDAWVALIQNSVEQNIYLEPAFALSAAQHSQPAAQPVFVIVSEAAKPNGEGKMLGLFAFQPFSSATGMVAKLWQTPQMTMSAPLIDANHAVEVLDALHDWFATEHSSILGISFSSLDARGPLARLFKNHARMAGLQTLQLDPRNRAIIHNDPQASQRIKDTIGSKRRKELRRLTRKLQARGPLIHVTYSEPKDIRAGLEQFLALEASGWKGKRGTAFLNDPSLTLFARTLARRFAIHDQFEIDILRLEDEPVAMAIILRNQSKAYYWKTAYNEDYRAYSPGVLLTWKLTERLLADETIMQIDSCAAPNHSMADHIFPDRAELVDMLISCKDHGEQMFQLAAGIEGARRGLRESAKRAYHSLRAMRD